MAARLETDRNEHWSAFGTTNGISRRFQELGRKVDSKAVSEFAAKLRYKRIEAGILVATNGITGDPDELSSAYQRVALEQADGRQILVLRWTRLKISSTPKTSPSS